jgi:predicted PurR-regulated permease PerM
VAALVPFLGASLVWLPTSITLFFNDHFVAGAAALFLGLVIVSSIDNLIRIMVLKGSAELHPLLVLICVFGGIQFAGVLGIFIGPAIGAIVFALLKVLRQEISALEGSASTPVTT